MMHMVGNILPILFVFSCFNVKINRINAYTTVENNIKHMIEWSIDSMKEMIEHIVENSSFWLIENRSCKKENFFFSSFKFLHGLSLVSVLSVYNLSIIWTTQMLQHGYIHRDPQSLYTMSLLFKLQIIKT